MQYSQEHLKTMVFGGQTECIMGDSKIENYNCIWLTPFLSRSASTNLFSAKRIVLNGRSGYLSAIAWKKKDFNI